MVDTEQILAEPVGPGRTSGFERSASSSAPRKGSFSKPPLASSSPQAAAVSSCGAKNARVAPCGTYSLAGSPPSRGRSRSASPTRLPSEGPSETEFSDCAPSDALPDAMPEASPKASSVDLPNSPFAASGESVPASPARSLGGSGNAPVGGVRDGSILLTPCDEISATQKAEDRTGVCCTPVLRSARADSTTVLQLTPSKRQDVAEPADEPVTPTAVQVPSVIADSSTQASSSSSPKRCSAKGVNFNISHTDYTVIHKCAKSRGWKLVKSEEKLSQSNVMWIDDGTIESWFPRIEPWMRVNHIPGMNGALARKTRLARNMCKMQRLFPKEYQFLPPSWVLPYDLADLERRFGEDGQSKAVYIVKPDHLCQGRGIFLTTELAKMKKCSEEMYAKDESAVVQRYISRPMLIEGLKFDLRLYFLVAGKLREGGGFDLRCFLFRDGLVRLCTTQYEPPTAETMNQRRMHLTNYAINKNSKDFEQPVDADDDSGGSKRSLRWFLRFVEEEFGEKERRKLWLKLMGLCVKTVLAVQPKMEMECSMAFPRDQGSNGSFGFRAFEVLGVDVMLDQKRRPYLIEVNHLPSFTCDSPLDEDIKSRVIDQVLDLTCGNLSPQDKKAYEQLVRGKREGIEVPPFVPYEGPLGPNALDVPSYKDFERAFPPPDGASKLTAQCETILEKVRESFKPMHVAQRKPEPPGPLGVPPRVAKEVGGREHKSSLPPKLPPKDGPCIERSASERATCSSARKPGSAFSQNDEVAGRQASHSVEPQPRRRPPLDSGSDGGGSSRPPPDKKRSRSAPCPPRCALPHILRRIPHGSYTPRGDNDPASPSYQALKNGPLRGAPAKPPPRVFLQMKSAQILL